MSNFVAEVLFICFLVCIILCLWNYYSRSFISGVDKKFVLVTGCDSGFGRETALTLDKLGFGVFATCLTKEGEESLKAVASSRVFPLHLDVTDSQMIKAVNARVKELLPPDCGWLATGHFLFTSTPPLPPPPCPLWRDFFVVGGARGFFVTIILNIF